MSQPKKPYDVFISHAGEDKTNFVKPLADFLREAGLAVWYDEFTLNVGDSLSRSIDRGLADSRFGIVVLSKAFLGKRWPEYELRGLVAKEIESGKTILPIWLDITKKEILEFSPPLADKLAISADHLSIEAISRKLMEVVKPDLYEKIHRRLQEANLLTSARKETVDLRKIKVAPIRHQRLSIELISRIRLVRAALLDVYPLSMEAWVDGFRRDTNPDQEVAIWERVASTYLEHAYSCDPSARKTIYDQVFSIIAMGIEPGGVSEDVRRRTHTAHPIEGKEVENYPKQTSQLLSATSPDTSSGVNEVADVVGENIVRKLRIDELRTMVAANNAVKIDIRELSQPEIQRLLAEAGVILGVDRNTGTQTPFYGRETLVLFAQRPQEPNLAFPRPVVMVSYDNGSDELELLYTLVQYLKGGCCYGIADSSTKKSNSPKSPSSKKRRAKRSSK